MMWFVPWNLGEASRVDGTDAIHEDDDDGNENLFYMNAPGPIA